MAKNKSQKSKFSGGRGKTGIVYTEVFGYTDEERAEYGRAKFIELNYAKALMLVTKILCSEGLLDLEAKEFQHFIRLRDKVKAKDLITKVDLKVLYKIDELVSK